MFFVTILNIDFAWRKIVGWRSADKNHTIAL